MKVKGKEKSVTATKTTRNGINANLDSYQRSMRIKHLAFYRAMRIKFIRTILEMNIDDFAKFTSIHQGALGRMERAEACASLHAAEVIARACVTNQLLDVRAEWIINGTGSCPTFIKKREIDITSYLRQLPEQQSAFNNAVDASTKKYLTTFLFTKLFQSTFNNIISVLVKDDKMLPMFQKGDLVFGEVVSESERLTLDGKTCILEFNNQIFLIRRVAVDSSGILILSDAYGREQIILQKNEWPNNVCIVVGHIKQKGVELTDMSEIDNFINFKEDLQVNQMQIEVI